MGLGGIFKELISPITGIVEELVVDKDKRNEIKLKIEELADKADERYHQELIAQTEVNKIEAAHASIFVAGWRPFIGWTSGVGLAYSFVLAPFIEFVARANGYTQEMPMPDAAHLLTLVTAMLGVGAMRSYDKSKGTAALPKNTGAAK
jgi:hypothetical protein